MNEAILKHSKIMSYANNNGSFPVPDYISTIDLTTETKPKFVKYFYYTVFNFAKQYSNPLILPFSITLDVIYHGTIDIGSNQFKSKTFAVEEVTGNKFNISGEGTAYFWYRYGKIDPASFNLIAQTAINNKDWLVLDAILHTRSFVEAIDFLVNNPQTWTIIAEGLDWQLNEIGARDLFAYLTNNSYDTRKLAQFLTILAYIDPDVLIKLGIPVYTCDNPNKTFEKYLEYLPASPLVPIYSELSEQTSEISELFAQTSELSENVFILMYQIMKIYDQLRVQQSEISELNIESLIHSSEIALQASEISDLFAQTSELNDEILTLMAETVRLMYQLSEQQSEINVIDSELALQSSQITKLFSITSEQGIQISDLFIETSEITSELTQLSENLILFTNAGKIVNEVLTIFHLFKATLTILKIIQQVVQTIAPLSELTIVSEAGCALNWLLGLVSEGLSEIISITDIQQKLQQLVNFLNNLIRIYFNFSFSYSETTSSGQSSGFSFNFPFQFNL